jgi:hypothetical protein
MNPQSKKLEVIMPGYRWHTQMFDNMAKDISEEDSLKKAEGKTNHMAWMFGNMVNNRYWLANLFGVSDKDPHDALFREGKALDASTTYPSIKELKENWHSISKKLFDKLLAVSDEELSEKVELGMNVDFLEENKLNMVGMSMDRTSYLLGQLALMRRAIANLGTNYDVNADINY